MNESVAQQRATELLHLQALSPLFKCNGKLHSINIKELEKVFPCVFYRLHIWFGIGLYHCSVTDTVLGIASRRPECVLQADKLALDQFKYLEIFCNFPMIIKCFSEYQKTSSLLVKSLLIHLGRVGDNLKKSIYGVQIVFLLIPCSIKQGDNKITLEFESLHSTD